MFVYGFICGYIYGCKHVHICIDNCAILMDKTLTKLCRYSDNYDNTMLEHFDTIYFFRNSTFIYPHINDPHLKLTKHITFSRESIFHLCKWTPRSIYRGVPFAISHRRQRYKRVDNGRTAEPDVSRDVVTLH